MSLSIIRFFLLLCPMGQWWNRKTKKKKKKKREKEKEKAIRLLGHVIANCIKESNNSFFVLSSSFSFSCISSFFVLSSSFSFLHFIFLCFIIELLFLAFDLSVYPDFSFNLKFLVISSTERCVLSFSRLNNYFIFVLSSDASIFTYSVFLRFSISSVSFYLRLHKDPLTCVFDYISY